MKAICAKVSRGVPQAAAAGALGIPRRTLQNWLAIGRQVGASEPYASFAARMQEALDQFHESRAVQVVEHAEKDPRSAMFLLERRFPDEWADPGRAGGVTVNVGVLVESPEWRDLASRLLDRLSAFPDALAAVADLMSGAPAAAVVEGDVVAELDEGAEES